MFQGEVKIENSKASIIISNLKCVEDEWQEKHGGVVWYDMILEF